MNKQQEIRKALISKVESIRMWATRSDDPLTPEEDADDILIALASQDVVIKVDRELPDSPWGFNADNGFTEARILTRGYYCAEQDMLMDGYVAVEPLVKVSK